MINDLGTTGSVDKMKLTGVTFTPVVAAGDKTTTVIISHTFSNGQLSGDYLWGMGMAGQFDPPTTENVVGDEVILVGTGLFADSQPLGTLSTGTLVSPTTNNSNGTINKSKATAVVKPGCNTNSSGKCTPTLTYTFTIKVRGQDTVKLTDSVIGAGGTCRQPGSVPDVPQGPPDPLPPGRSCAAVAAQADAEIQSDIRAELRAAKKEGSVVPVTCDDTNTCGTIIILKDVGTFAGIEFGFTGTGSGLTDFSITPPGNQTFSGLETGVAGGSREINETVPDGWYLSSVTCVNALLPDENGDTDWSTGYYNNEGPVIVYNLEAGDTLTCTFTNYISD
ncbi:MAG: hypothetical protein SGJ26_09930 [Nitrospirota bacterium]|nr:hypothetical protein [Nitrospirota bacterium]